MCNWRNTIIIITTTITIISGGGIGTTIIIITTIIIATIDGREDAEIRRDPLWGPVLFRKLSRSYCWRAFSFAAR